MSNIEPQNPLVRPKTLIRAARINMKYYVRERSLGKLLDQSNIPQEGAAHVALGHKESAMNSARKSGALSYKVQDHIAVLTALLTEYALLRRTQSS